MIVFAFAAGFCGMPALTLAQAGDNDKTLLEGKWVLESTSIRKITGSDTVRVDADEMKDNPFFALYDTLLFKADTLTIPFSDTFSQGEYRLTDDKIEFNFMPVTHLLRFVVENEKIDFTQYVLLDCEDCTYSVQTVYKKDSHEDDE